MKIEYSFLISVNKPSFKDEDAKEFLDNLSSNLKTTFIILSKSNTKVKIIVMSNLIEYIKEIEKQKYENTHDAMALKNQNSEKAINELKQKLDTMSKLNEAFSAKSKETEAFMDQIQNLNNRIIELDNEKTQLENEINLLNMTIKNIKDNMSFDSERKHSLSILKNNPKLLSDINTNYDEIYSNYEGTFGSEFSDESKKEDIIKKEQEYKESLTKKEEIINSLKQENLTLKKDIEDELIKSRRNDILISEAKVIQEKFYKNENLHLEVSKLELKNLHLSNKKKMLKQSITELIKNSDKLAMEKLELSIENKKQIEALKVYEKSIEELIKKINNDLNIKQERDALKENVIELKSQIESFTIISSNLRKELHKNNEYSKINNIEFDFNFNFNFNFNLNSPNSLNVSQKSANDNNNKNVTELNEDPISKLNRENYELQLNYINIYLQFIQSKKILELFVIKISEYDEYIKSLKEEYNKKFNEVFILENIIEKQLKEFEITRNEFLGEIEKTKSKINEKDLNIENLRNFLNIEINKQIKFSIYDQIIKEWIEKGEIKSNIPISLKDYTENIRIDLELVMKNYQFVQKLLLDLFQQSEESIIEKMVNLNALNELKTNKRQMPEFLNNLSKLKATQFHFLDKIKVNNDNVNVVLRLIHPFIEHKLSKLQKYRDKISQNRNQKEQLKQIFDNSEYLIRKILKN